jgi:acyl-CoA thioester hydrolase
MHTETVMVYFEDLDAMGVVHNGRYATLLERALAGYWTRAGWPYDPGQPRFAEVLFAVREFAITYHLPITRVGTVQVRFWLDHAGTTSLIYRFQILSDHGSLVHAEGRRVQVRLDPVTLRPTAIGPELREACRQLLAPAKADAREAA